MCVYGEGGGGLRSRCILRHYYGPKRIATYRYTTCNNPRFLTITTRHQMQKPLLGQNVFDEQIKKIIIIMHWPGVEPGSTAWKAAMLTVTPPMPPSVESGRMETV